MIPARFSPLLPLKLVCLTASKSLTLKMFFSDQPSSSCSDSSSPNKLYPNTPFIANQELREHLIYSLNNSFLIKHNLSFNQLEEWLTRPPHYTTIRVDTSAISLTDAILLLKEKMIKHDSNANLIHHKFTVHPLLNDLIIIESLQSSQVINDIAHLKEVVIDLKAGHAVLRGAKVYGQGILNAPASLKPGEEVCVFADLAGKCLKGSKKQYNDRKAFIGIGKSHVSRRDLFGNSSTYKGVAIEMTNTVYSCPSLTWQTYPFFYQNLPSIVCIHVLDPKPGQSVLDMCAAPGGKTTHIASLMKKTGTLVACDVNPNRIKKLKQNLNQWNLSQFVEVAKLDFTKILHPNWLNSALNEFAFLNNLFDCILVDAPCSGIGVRPKLKSDLSLKSFLAFTITQKKLLKAAQKLLKVNGTLVYSTCSFSVDENEKVVCNFLENHSNMQLESQHPNLGRPGFEGDHSLSKESLNKLQRFINFDQTSPEKDTIGFFIAKFRKIA